MTSVAFLAPGVDVLKTALTGRRALVQDMAVFPALACQRVQCEGRPFQGQQNDQKRARDKWQLFARGPSDPLHRVGLQHGCSKHDYARPNHENRVGKVLGFILKILFRWRHGGSVSVKGVGKAVVQFTAGRHPAP